MARTATGRHFDDFRPEVHDSDGLMTQTGTGEWLWRPLVNPRALRVNRFMDRAPARLRPDSARPGLRSLPGQRVALSSSARATGSSRSGTGARAASSWWRSRPTRRSTTISSRTGCRKRPVQPHKPIAFSYLLSAYSHATHWPPGGRVIATRTGSVVTGPSAQSRRRHAAHGG